MPNENYRESDILGGISYLSVFFAPVLFPLIVWIVAQPPASIHARNALFNHIMSWVMVVLGLVTLSISPAFVNSEHGIGWINCSPHRSYFLYMGTCAIFKKYL